MIRNDFWKYSGYIEKDDTYFHLWAVSSRGNAHAFIRRPDLYIIIYLAAVANKFQKPTCCLEFSLGILFIYSAWITWYVGGNGECKVYPRSEYIYIYIVDIEKIPQSFDNFLSAHLRIVVLSTGLNCYSTSGFSAKRVREELCDPRRSKSLPI